MPPLLEERSPAVQMVLGAIVPASFGALVGLFLITSEPAYLVGSVLGIGGGYFAGLEHHGAADGAARGFIGGFLFGLFILTVRELTGEEEKALIPEPAAGLLVITVVFGMGLGALGGHMRARHARKHEPHVPEAPAET